jgi:carboxypeptidase Taq
MSAQLYAAAVTDHPDIPAHIATGGFGTLRDWLRRHVYTHGAKFTANEVMRQATGEEVSIQPYVDYLWRKYQPLYQLERQGLP